jgi:hypothetical protein
MLENSFFVYYMVLDFEIFCYQGNTERCLLLGRPRNRWEEKLKYILINRL